MRGRKIVPERITIRLSNSMCERIDRLLADDLFERSRAVFIRDVLLNYLRQAEEEQVKNPRLEGEG